MHPSITVLGFKEYEALRVTLAGCPIVRKRGAAYRLESAELPFNPSPLLSSYDLLNRSRAALSPSSPLQPTLKHQVVKGKNLRKAVRFDQSKDRVAPHKVPRRFLHPLIRLWPSSFVYLLNV